MILQFLYMFRLHMYSLVPEQYYISINFNCLLGQSIITFQPIYFLEVLYHIQVAVCSAHSKGIVVVRLRIYPFQPKCLLEVLDHFQMTVCSAP